MKDLLFMLAVAYGIGFSFAMILIGFRIYHAREEVKQLFRRRARV